MKNKKISLVKSLSFSKTPADTATINALQDLPIAVVIFTATNILYLNNEAVNIFKPSKSLLNSIQTHSIFEFVLPEFHDSFRGNYAGFMNGEKFITNNIKIINAKKEIIDLEVKSNVTFFCGEQAIQTIFTDVSEKTKSQLELAVAKNRLELISQNANDLIFFYTYKPKPTYIFISESVKKSLGYTPNDFYKNPKLGYQRAIDKVGYLKFETKLSKLQSKGLFNPISIAFQYKTKSGKLIWLEDNYSPIIDDKGKVTHILGISRDITIEKNYQIKLENKWNDYKNIIENSPIGIFIHDNGKCLYHNKTAATILEVGLTQNLIGKSLLKYIVPNQQQKALNRLKKATQGQILNNSVIYQIKTFKGNVIEVNLKTIPFDFNGKGCAQTTIINITTEKKLAEEVLRTKLAEKTNAVLVRVINERNETQAKLNTIFNTSTHIIWTIDKNYTLTSFNKNYENQLNEHYQQKVKVGIDFKQLYKSMLSKQDFIFWMAKYKQVFDGKNIIFETEKIQENGQKIYREVYLNPILNDKGQVTEVAAITHNITSRKINENNIQAQAAKLDSIFESSSHIIWTVDKEFRITSFNKNFARVFKYNYNADVKINIALDELLAEEKKTKYKSYWYELYKQVLKGNLLKFERKELGENNAFNYKEIYLSPIRNKQNEIIEIACLAHDITENKIFEQKILNQSAKLSAIFESGNYLIWSVNQNLELTSQNKNYYNFINSEDIRKKLDDDKIVSVLDTIQNKEKKLFWLKKYKTTLNGQSQIFINKSIINGTAFYREVYLYPIYLNYEVVEVSAIAQDITERIHYEQQLLNQSAKLNAIFESGDQLMWTITKDLKLTSFNKNYTNAIYNLYHFYPEVGKSIREIGKNKTSDFEGVWNEKYKLAFSGKQVEFTTDRKLLDGTQVFRQYYLYPIFNDTNEVIEISGLGFDVTKNKLNEEKIIQSLKEKEILLKEVHHRVKNNMQVISSILNLQSSYVNDEYALNLLTECQNRIKSMSFIHESLYQSKNFESVNFSEYITTLTKNLVHTYSINTSKIKLVLSLQKLFLNLDISIPCGLIINEIISNSLKYAFPNNADGIIFVTLKVKNNKVTIEAGDNGIGIPKTLDIKNTQTLGLQLVDTLIDQIDGTFTLDRIKGTKFIIEFNL